MLNHLKVSTKLLGVIGIVVAAASVAVGWFVLQGAEQALYAQSSAQLEAERASRARFLSLYFRRLNEQLGISSRQLVTQIALRDTATQPDRLRELFQPYAAGLVEAFGYANVLLAAADGAVVYSLTGEGLATSLRAGPLRDSGLAHAFTAASTLSAGAVHFVDYRPHAPSGGVPAAFAGVPVFDTATKARLGVLVFQVPVDEVSDIVTDAAGFGESGETYLIGPDFLMRTNSRFSKEPTALKLTITTEGTRRALAGESGTNTHIDYRGVPVIASFAPVDVAGVRWAIVSKIDVDEALAPARLFRNRLLLLLLAVGLVAGFVLWESLRRIVLSPVAALAAGARRVAAHDYAQAVALAGGDELGQLGQSFDSMMKSVGAQVDELQTAERNLRESEERLAAAARGANIGLWDVDPRGGQVLVNAIFESQLGYAPLGLREANGKWAPLRGGLTGWVELLHPDDRARVAELIALFLAGQSESYVAEHRVRRPDGSYSWILSVGNSVSHDEDGKPLRVNGVHIDITQMKRLQHLRDGLVHMIVHDLRSPLQSVMGYMDLVRTETHASAEERAKFVEEAYGSAAEMAEMISSLLDINRLEANEMPVDRQSVDLREVAAEAIRSLGGLAMGRRLSQTAPEGPVLSNCDPALIRRVIVNLLGNALKFTPESGTITVSVSRTEGRPSVTVADTGPGIPADFLGKVFDKFSQSGEGRSHKRYSTGLGLAFCKLAVEAHGGSIGVTSAVGAGSQFWFQLPD